ncbi:hypothetical protein CC1G_07161 [Coprinopsis cinerea okayama7|uniref:Uncharacterized protein n=1 Tax=Coprinopsis cinerea (strain Okayama-7 / 130 / ATCC MYA-4618 / FGSC 9003) TaxID=240176 RepID=A8NRA7_COPC7|nr:hypothetical protein CC1G_07161 [Coprinopsis cinerea okayama7\|eukprot:XP_001835737.2 hypothetical protein CC1G_07161 [Coprinopsis cinerea okayama7\
MASALPRRGTFPHSTSPQRTQSSTSPKNRQSTGQVGVTATLAELSGKVNLNSRAWAKYSNRTHSVHTSDALPSGSQDDITGQALFLRSRFPAIYTTLELLTRSEGRNDFDSFRGVASAFYTIYINTFEELKRFSQEVPKSQELLDCLESGASIGRLFKASIEILEEQGRSISNPFDALSQQAHFCVKRLEIIYRKLQLTPDYDINKDLPGLPSQGTVQGSRPTLRPNVARTMQPSVQAPVSKSLPTRHTRQSSTETNTSARTHPAQSSRDSSSTFVASSLGHSRSPSTDTRASSTSSLRRGMLGVQPTASSSKLRLAAGKAVDAMSKLRSRNQSTATLSETMAGPEIPHYLANIEDVEDMDDLCYRNRRSYSRDSTLSIDEEVLRTFETAQRPTSVAYDPAGKPHAASIHSLITILTTRQKDLTIYLQTLSTLFSSFRLFTTPRQLFEVLINRFEETGPDVVDKQQAFLWVAETRRIRNRVVKIFTYWLDQHYDSVHDTDIVEEISHYFEAPIMTELVHSDVLAELIKKIRAIEAPTPNPTPTQATFQPKRRVLRTFAPRKTILPNEEFFVQIMTYNHPRARKEFAQQLTIAMSDMYSRITALGMLKFLLLKPEERRAMEASRECQSKEIRDILAVQDMEDGLSMWVTYTIVKQQERQQRVDLIVFFLDVAMYLLNHRDFSSCYCIYSGVAHSAIEQMKETVVCVPKDSKAQYHKLKDFFRQEDNYSHVRQAMKIVGTPMVPLLGDPPQTRQGTNEDKELINLRYYGVLTKEADSLKRQPPYKFQPDETFQVWLFSHLRRFLDANERLPFHVQFKFHARGRKREAKNPDLAFVSADQLTPWHFVPKSKGKPEFNQKGLALLDAKELSVSATILQRSLSDLYSFSKLTRKTKKS